MEAFTIMNTTAIDSKAARLGGMARVGAGGLRKANAMPKACEKHKHDNRMHCTCFTLI